MPNKMALNAVMATLAAAMRHSPAFDIVQSVFSVAARGKGALEEVDFEGAPVR